MRPIDADKLRYSTEWCVDEAGFGATFTVVHKEEIDNAPTLDVEPVRRGKWVDVHTGQICFINADGGVFTGVLGCECSVCGGYLDGSDEYTVTGRYCPNCGTKMEKL